MSNNTINIRSDSQGKIHIVSSAHCDEFKNYITNSTKRKQDNPKNNDIIIECQGKKYNLNHNVGVTNSKLLKSWSTKMNGSGFTVDMNNCKDEAVEAALILLNTGTLTIADDKILDVYRVLAKLECNTQEKDFYNYINKCIIRKENSPPISHEKEHFNFSNTAINNHTTCNNLFQKLMNDVKNIQENIDFLVTEKKNDSKYETKTVRDLPDINMNNNVPNTKLIFGKRVYDYRDIEEIRKLPDFFKTKKDNYARGKNFFTETEISDLNKLPDIIDYKDAKIVVGKKVYDICDVEDFKKLPNYFEKIKESCERTDNKSKNYKNYMGNNLSQRSTSVDTNSSRNVYGLKKMHQHQNSTRKMYAGNKNAGKNNYNKYIPHENVVTPPGQGNYITTEINPSYNHFSIKDSTAYENYQLPSNFNRNSIKSKNSFLAQDNINLQRKTTKNNTTPYILPKRNIPESNDVIFVPPIDFFKNHYNGPNYEH
uniref:BTB domain-containing protein n=1 Tax=Strongyloides venezuelensis TaxID=75913 RepID=A0A0K0F7G5_STRVS